MNEIIITTSVGTLRKGDIMTFEYVSYYPWYKWFWYHLRYMRHNNPMFKPVELRQFIILCCTAS